jgi:hypothetical protein
MSSRLSLSDKYVIGTDPQIDSEYHQDGLCTANGSLKNKATIEKMVAL